MTVAQRFCILHHAILLDHLSNVSSSHYARASLQDRFDTFIWFAGARAVTSLEAVSAPGTDDRWPWTSVHAGVSYDVISLVPA
jgi:hypothetical protein